jgi:chromate transporter
MCVAAFVGYSYGWERWARRPDALAGHMQQDLVDDRGWVNKEDYLQGRALAQLARGLWPRSLPLLSAIFARECWAHCGRIAFILPSFLMVLALSAAYVALAG